MIQQILHKVLTSPESNEFNNFYELWRGTSDLQQVNDLMKSIEEYIDSKKHVEALRIIFFTDCNSLQTALELTPKDDITSTINYCENIIITLQERISFFIEWIELRDPTRTKHDTSLESEIESFSRSFFMYPSDFKPGVTHLLVLTAGTYRRLINTIQNWITSKSGSEKSKEWIAKTKLLFLGFSGFLEMIRVNAEKNSIKGLDRKIAEIIALLCDEKASNIIVTYPYLKTIMNGKLDEGIFSLDMLNVTKSSLEKIGLDVTLLTEIIAKKENSLQK